MKSCARREVDNQNLNQMLLYKALRNTFPKKNDYNQNENDYAEELAELIYFRITTVKALRRLLKKHRRKILEIDRSPMDKYHQKMYRDEMGVEIFNDHTRRQYWFAYPGLLRIALELEFGNRYVIYANERDGI